MVTLVEDLKKSLEAIKKWSKKIRFKVNDDKTELCLFHGTYQGHVSVRVNEVNINSKSSMNVPGEISHYKFHWNEQVANTTNKTLRALHCVKQIKLYFPLI